MVYQLLMFLVMEIPFLFILFLATYLLLVPLWRRSNDVRETPRVPLPGDVISKLGFLAALMTALIITRMMYLVLSPALLDWSVRILIMMGAYHLLFGQTAKRSEAIVMGMLMGSLGLLIGGIPLVLVSWFFP